jgi:hypothetical protein
MGGLVDPRNGIDVLANRKIPATSENEISLYRLAKRLTDRAIKGKKGTVDLYLTK